MPAHGLPPHGAGPRPRQGRCPARPANATPGDAPRVLQPHRIRARTRGIPVIVTCAAAVAAMAALSVKRIAVINPPWFSDEIDQKGADYFRRQGIEVVYSGPTGTPGRAE